MFIFESETECEWGKGRERGRHRIRSSLQALDTEPDVGLELMNCEIMTMRQSRTLNRLSHPGAPG